ncbi:MAG: deoxyguanosinetriphosphate triphosphohydrolase [Chloroflexi bacterium]|nr:deoxyguanosinetriphosphate triphosphohydrolase [Chloroflexota bacterium]
MARSREELEALERQVLAPYAVKSGDTLGTEHPDEPPTHRTYFQRDRDRIVHTTAFRRLEYKTQVFVNFEGDYYRTRLTHTLEVTQVGRTIARALGLNEDLVEAICLVHDLGHPPFGHSGEFTLNDLMADHGGFEHNKQSLRIVTKLERRYPEWRGLNLTYECREGIVKHETEYDASEDNQDYRPELRGSLEAQISNVADELAYNTHDLDDGLRAGLITPQQLQGLELWEMLAADVGYDGGHLDELTRHCLVRRMLGLQLQDVITTTSANIEASGVQSPEDVQRLDHNLISHSEEYQQMNKPYKAFLYENLYNHYRVVRMSRKARRFLTDLFEAYTSTPAQLPPSVQEKINHRGVYRAATDYIAGMTDRYALQEWERLFSPFVRP